MLSGKYKYFYLNDIDGRGIRLFDGAIRGKYFNDKHWVSRGEFKRNKQLPINQQNPMISIIWSFGNNMKDYMYSKQIEPYKKALHQAIVNDQWEEIGLIFPEHVDDLKGILDSIDLSDIHLRRLALQKNLHDYPKSKSGRGLENLERLQSLERLNITCTKLAQCLPNIETSFIDFSEVKIKPNSVIVCDPPYKNTNCGGYGFKEYERFYEWCLWQTEPIYICGYAMPENLFAPIADWDINILSESNGTTKNASEKLFAPIRG